MKKLTMSAVLLAATAMAPSAFAQDVSFSAGADAVSEYVFRGISFGDSSVQPYAEASIGGLTAGVWYSAGFGEESDLQGDEVDLYVGYSLPLDGSISVDVGATYYHFPQGGSLFETDGGNAGSYEVYGSVGFGDLPLSPSLTAYYDFTFEALTLEGSVGHSFAVNDDVSFDLGLTAGHVSVDGGGNYEWATASASIGKSFSNDVSFYVGANFSVNSEDLLDFDVVEEDGLRFATLDSDTKFWVGSGFSVSFE